MRLKSRILTIIILIATIVLAVLPAQPVQASILYEYYNTGDDDYELFGGAIWWSETFTTTSVHPISSVKLKLYKSFFYPGIITVSIRAVDGLGKPTGDDLCSGITDGNTLVGSPGEWREITFGTVITLTDATVYAIVLRAYYNGYWRVDSSSPAYSGGNEYYSVDSGVTWTDATGDLMFEVYSKTPPTVTTGSVSSITATTAIGSGNITNIGDENADIRGVCWNTTGTPTITDSKSQETGSFGIGEFSENITGLSGGTFYYVRAYAHNGGGYSYGSSTNFTTANDIPTVTTQSASSINATTAVGNYTITDDGGDNCTTIGVQWGIATGVYTSNATQSGNFIEGVYTANMTSLTAGQTYYYRGIAQNTEGWGYGNEMSFTAVPTTPATVITVGSSGIGVNYATLQGQLISFGSENTSSVGFQYGTTIGYGTYTAEIEKTSTTGVGSYSIQIAGLSYATAYHFRATARYGLYYVYGADMTFTTLPAVGSSTDLLIRSAEVFPNYGETGSLLFCVEYVNNYTYLFPDKSPAKYFSVQVLATNNIDILASTPLPNWGDRPVGIYINPTYTASSFIYGSHYYIKVLANDISGSPASGMSVSYQLTDNDWNGGAQDVNYNPLDSWCIGTAYHMEIADNSYDYITLTTDVGKQINDNAGGYFTGGIVGLSQVRPDLFTSAQLQADLSVGTDSNIWDSLTAWQTAVGSTLTAETNTLGAPFGVTGKEVLNAIIILIIIILMIASEGKPLAIVALSIPLVWCGVYFRITPFWILTFISGFFLFMFIRQFIWKTL